MENKIIEDFVVFVEKLYKETNIHPARIEYIIKNFWSIVLQVLTNGR